MSIHLKMFEARRSTRRGRNYDSSVKTNEYEIDETIELNGEENSIELEEADPFVLVQLLLNKNASFCGIDRGKELSRGVDVRATFINTFKFVVHNAH